MATKQGGEPGDGGAVVARAAGGIDGVMAHHHLPGGVAAGQGLLQPGLLLGPVGAGVGVEQEEGHRPAPMQRGHPIGHQPQERAADGGSSG